jgi:PleD family two-component response regulator
LPHGGGSNARTIKTLLIGEDAEGTQFVKAALEAYDHHLLVETASPPRKAAKSIRLGDYDCVVACCQISTLGVAELVKTSQGLHDTPVIVYSCDGEGASILKAFNMGVADYVFDEGPTSYEALAARVRRAAETWRDSMRDAATHP